MEFAQAELVVPEGKHKDERWRPETLPWQRLWFEAIDSGNWRRHFLTACVQGGKTFVGWVAIVLWKLFEHRVNWGAGVPTGDVAHDKWRLELEPAINANPQFRALLPEAGRGSQGGEFESITFQHGVTLKFLTGHGGDEKRSSITLAGSAVTEADRLDVAGEASREAAPIYQIEARALASGEDAQFYAECTSTTEDGIVTRERCEGTDSRPFAQCRECREWVSPEREHLVGWEEAAHEIEAGAQAVWCCPACGIEIDDGERRRMQQAGAKLVHRGQTIDKEGVIHGDLPATRTFGLRVNGFWNLFWSTALIAEMEWKAKRDKDPESAERKMRQWVWALPNEPEKFDVVPLTQEDVIGRTGKQLRGVLPPGTVHLSGGADLRGVHIHFVVVAWVLSELAGGWVGYVVDAGLLKVESKQFGFRRGLRKALAKLDERLAAGYAAGPEDRDGARRSPGWFFIDGNWQTQTVAGWINERRAAGVLRYLPTFGKGQSVSESKGGYSQPTAVSVQKPFIGDQYFVSWQRKQRLWFVVVNADYYKLQVHDGFAMDEGQPGSLVLFEPSTTDDEQLVRLVGRHVVAEKETVKIVPGRGPVKVFENTTRHAAHMLDALGLACASGHMCGVRVAERAAIVPAAAATAPTTEPAPSIMPGGIMPDGGAFLLTDRE